MIFKFKAKLSKLLFKKLFLRVKCLDSNGDYRGLLEILQELNLIDDIDECSNFLLPKLREILSNHPAFRRGKYSFESTCFFI